MNEKTKDILEWIVCIVIAVVIALLFRYYIGTPTQVNMTSMVPTLQNKDRLILNRTARITKKRPQRGDIITFEAPSRIRYLPEEVNQSNPVAEYKNEHTNIFSKFLYYNLEIGKTSYIKRAIGLPGDKVEIKDGKIYINGEILNEPYLKDDVVTESNNYNNFTVPEGYIFAIGDNRTGSLDCRVFGCIPFEKIEGIVLCRIWPLNKFGKIDT